MPLTQDQIESILGKCKSCGKILSGRQRDFCSNKCKVKFHQTNSYNAQQARGLERKLKLIEYKGGGCERCGYNKNVAALDFHHRDEKEKLFKIDLRNISNRSIEGLVSEVDKCDLLCANCHREEHNPQLDMDILNRR